MIDSKDKTVFNADKVKISGPTMDGSFRVTFDVGEYEFQRINNLPLLNGKILVVAVVTGEDLKKKSTMKVEENESSIEGAIQEME